MYNISTMAEKLGVSTSTLRNWDKSGVLQAKRKPSGHRYYTHEQYLKTADKQKYIQSNDNTLEHLRDKVVLITGGTGSLGNAIVERISDYAKKIIVYSRCELKQAKMKQKFHGKENIRYLIGDVQDKNRLSFALRGVDVCIHAACMKRVETCTYNPFEAVKNNVMGSVNVVEACIENNVGKSLLVSTDKACAPCTLYGGTKFVAEQLFINGNNYSTRGGTKFFATRYGNVYASNGSVRYIFENQAKEGALKVTHKDMTRFFMSMDEAVDLNLYAVLNGIGGEIFIPKLKGTSILRYAQAFAPGVPVEFIGLRGYEKIHEELISTTEIMYTVDCGKYYKVVPPNISEPALGWDFYYPEEQKVKEFVYSSNSVEQFTEEELLDFEK
jgi:FlaA1/EpsC-like NDP-sugar epimerase